MKNVAGGSWKRTTCHRVMEKHSAVSNVLVL